MAFEETSEAFDWFTVIFQLIKGLAVIMAIKMYSRYSMGRCKDTRDMSGKTMIITGGNSGIGKETAKELARRNVRVIIACRNQSKAKEAAQEILQDTGREVVIKELDLCSFTSIRKFVADIAETEGKVDVLINNAGCFPSPKHVATEDGFDSGLQSNHLGPFLLTNLLLDLLKKSDNGRIVNLSSVGHMLGWVDPDQLEYKDYQFPFLFYCDTKLANLIFTKELSRRLKGTGITANACHPGIVATEIATRYLSLTNIIFRFAVFLFGKSANEGAQTTVYLAVSDEVRDISGKYFVDCKPSWIFPNAWSRKRARKLWEASEKMVGISSADIK